MISLTTIFLVLGVTIFVLAFGVAVPLTGLRRAAVIILRIAGIVCALLAARGLAYSKTRTQPRHLLYLVDQSASIDPAQTEWMARRLASLEAIRPAHVSRAVAVFGHDSRVVLPPGRERLIDPASIRRLLEDAPIRRDETNMEAALLAALAPPPQSLVGGLAVASSPARSRLILLSDGRQTAGDVEDLLPYVRRSGLEVYPISPPSTVPAGVVWERLSVPSVVKRGASAPLKLVFANGTPTPRVVEVTVSLRGLPVARTRTPIRPGWGVASVSVPALTTGTMALEVSVVTSPAAEPQRRHVMIEVQGPPKLLVVMERPSQLPFLATALKHREMEIAVITPEELPRDVGALLDDDAVVLFQVPKSAIDQAQADALQRYVERFGGGIVMVGLGGVLHDEVTHAAPVDALLPVVFEPKGLQEAKRRVCVILLIDRSASMMGPRIAATKQAAVELVKQLAPEDLIGVLAFDTVPYVIVEVQQTNQVRTSLIDKLVRLKSVGGTDILPALRAARERLEMTGATVKHVILLSDGQTPFDRSAYQQELAQYARQQMSLSTIGIGPAMVNTDLLGWLAKTTGGTFYSLRNLEELPRLVVLDTEKALGRLPFAEGYFQVQRSERSDWFGRVEEWPSLRGYLTTTAKPEATVELSIPHPDARHPLLADWKLGKGHVAVFTSDAQTRWSPEWVRWPRFEAVWAEIIQRMMRSRPAEELFVWVDTQAGASAQVVLEGALQHPSASVVLRDGDQAIPPPSAFARSASSRAQGVAFGEAIGGGIIPLALVQHGRFQWRAPVDHLRSGWYQLVIESDPSPNLAQDSAQQADQPTRTEEPVGLRGTFLKRWIQIGRSERGAEQPHLPADEALLHHIAQATNGIYDVPDRAFLPPTQRVTVQVPLRGLLLPLAILLLLIDVALRGRTML